MSELRLTVPKIARDKERSCHNILDCASLRSLTPGILSFGKSFLDLMKTRKSRDEYGIVLSRGMCIIFILISTLSIFAASPTPTRRANNVEKVVGQLSGHQPLT